MRISFAGLVAALTLSLVAAAPARAAAAADMTEVALMQLEERAAKADPREQCFLYTELVQNYTEIAGRQMAAGEMEKAGATLKRVDAFAAHIHVGLAKDTKRLKTAEVMMSTSTHRLSQYMQNVSTEDKALVRATLLQLTRVNDELLAQVFAH